VACDPAVDLDIDIPLGHATLKLFKLYLKRRSAAAKRKHGLGHLIATARVRDVQLDDVFPAPRPSVATITANRKNPATVCHLASNRR
jgi:hypothetical protein